MKKFFLLLIVLLSINSFGQFSLIDTLSISKELRDKVYNFTINNAEVCNNGKYQRLDADTAEEQMLKWYSLSSLSKNCNWYNERFGRIEKIKLEQILKSKNKNLIFRYKVFRVKADTPQELRTFYSFRDKYYGFKGKVYWQEEYDRNNKMPTLFIQSLDKVSINRQKELEGFAFNSYYKCERNLLPEITESNTEYRSFRKDWVSEMFLECDSIKKKNGEIKSLKLVQYLSDDVYSKVYRFRVKFEKLSKPSEIRIYANIKDKYRGIFVVDRWYSNYLEFREAIAKSEIDLNNQSN
ncbi:hypothetical protein [Tenacibaculum crassostreae]|uniref:hypothetical protein n=1 Tax=Tenacibaculum crassostreae TaxID=502683 RepID=UPI003893D26E